MFVTHKIFITHGAVRHDILLFKSTLISRVSTVYSSVTHLPGAFLPSDLIENTRSNLLPWNSLISGYFPNWLMLFCS